MLKIPQKNFLPHANTSVQQFKKVIKRGTKKYAH